ncbi:MAG: hypothetical protein ACK4SY_08065 [Pyrobaculum sp.]
MGAGKLGSLIALRHNGIGVKASVKTERSRERLLSLGLEAYVDNRPVVETSELSWR